MDVATVHTALKTCGFRCSVISVTSHSIKLQILNEEDFYGLKGSVSCGHKGKYYKLCASFLIPSWTDDHPPISIPNCTLKVVRKPEETYLKFIASSNADQSLDLTLSFLHEGIRTALTVLPHIHSCGNTLQFTEALSLRTPDSSQQYTRTCHSVVLPTVVIEGNEQDLEVFRAAIAEDLRSFVLWEALSGSKLQGRQWYLCGSESGLPNAQDWLMSLYDKGICFKQTPCQYIYYYSPANDFRLLPGPLHCEVFALVPTPPRDDYLCQVARELALSAAEHQNSCIISLSDPEVLSRISAADRLPIECFTEQDLTKCEIIGKGGFGNILLNTLIDRRTRESVKVAMKVIKPEKLGKLSNLEALIQEYRILRSCNHPDIIKVFGYTLYQSTLVIVMEYCSKKTLYKYILENSLTVAEKLALLVQVANGLTYLHAKNICHLDLKPQNILVDNNNTAKLSDFGLSKTTVGDKKTGKSGYTLLYSAPEQIDGQDPGLESDIWAYGNIMYFVMFEKGPVDYMKAPTDNVHSFATKKLILTELKENRRKPLIPVSFEQSHPNLICLMRNCWVLESVQRLKAFKLLRSLTKLHQSLLKSSSSPAP